MNVNPKQRRRHSARFKAQVLAACAEPGESVATVAMRPTIYAEGREIDVGRTLRRAERVSTMIPPGRWGTPAEAAGAVMFLCKPEAE